MVCDFGQSAIDDINGYSPTNGGCVTYTPPEMFEFIEGRENAEQRRPMLPKADVYATGLTAYQVVLILHCHTSIQCLELFN